MQGVTELNYSIDRLTNGVDVVTFLAETGSFSSKGEARKMIQGGGISINRKKVDTIQLTIDKSMLLHNKYMLIQKGKTSHYLVRIQ
jgi:tyrosyl-tRNA synthetase